jgi:uncharacterized protein YceH (UPF0502 family)
MNATLPLLTPIEARILGVLVEKEKIAPDTYPLTLNGLAAGCNQKTSRDPVMSLSESEIQSALEALRGRLLVLENYGASGRVLRYTQNFAKVYGLPRASVALLSMLVLRGPQTVSELRANCARLHRFDDASSVEAYLEELAARGDGALLVKLPKPPGAREHRWAQLLCGDAAPPLAPDAPRERDGGALEERLARLEHEVAELRAALTAIAAGAADKGA